VILGLIGASTTGLKVQCHLDERIYAKGRRIPDRQLAEVNLVPDVFHGEWNYTIRHSGGDGKSIQ